MRLTNSQRLKARQLRKDMTDAERLLWWQLRDREKFDVKFRRQFPIGSFIVDFVCLERKLVIEVDGSQHMDQVDYDAERTQWLENNGFHVLRLWNNDVLLRTEQVCQAIWLALRKQSDTAEVDA